MGYTYDVFISHQGTDAEAAKHIADGLRRFGLAVFLDRDVLDAGDNLRASIESAVRSSRKVLVLVSPRSAGSKWVSLEAAIALFGERAGGRLIPIMIADTDMSTLPIAWQELVIKDFTNANFKYTADYAALFKRLAPRRSWAYGATITALVAVAVLAVIAMQTGLGASETGGNAATSDGFPSSVNELRTASAALAHGNTFVHESIVFSVWIEVDEAENTLHHVRSRQVHVLRALRDVAPEDNVFKEVGSSGQSSAGETVQVLNFPPRAPQPSDRAEAELRMKRGDTSSVVVQFDTIERRPQTKNGARMGQHVTLGPHEESEGYISVGKFIRELTIIVESEDVKLTPARQQAVRLVSERRSDGSYLRTSTLDAQEAHCVEQRLANGASHSRVYYTWHDIQPDEWIGLIYAWEERQ